MTPSGTVVIVVVLYCIRSVAIISNTKVESRSSKVSSFSDHQEIPDCYGPKSINVFYIKAIPSTSY
jgi:hypothetical protein